MINRKADILIRGEQGRAFPCVNVKVRIDFDRTIDALIAKGKAEFAVPGFDSAWIRANLDERGISLWYDGAIEDAWRDLQDRVTAIWPGRKVYSTGRSGGYAYIDGFTAEHVETWDAIQLAKWRKFDRECADLVADLPYRFAWGIWANLYEPQQADARAEVAAAQRAEVWTLTAVAACEGGS
jgi:hypothetical protein